MRKTLNGKSSRCDVSKERNCHRLKAVLEERVPKCLRELIRRESSAPQDAGMP